jgi:hypothetical protein
MEDNELNRTLHNSPQDNTDDGEQSRDFNESSTEQISNNTYNTTENKESLRGDKQPHTTRALVKWVKETLGVAPIPYYFETKTLAGNRLRVPSYKTNKGYQKLKEIIPFRKVMPSDRNINVWTGHPQTSVGFMNGKSLVHEINVNTIDFDFNSEGGHTGCYCNSQDELVNLIKSHTEKYPGLRECPWYWTRSGGVHFIVLTEEPTTYSRFTLSGYEGKHIGEVITNLPSALPHPESDNGLVWGRFIEKPCMFKNLAELGIIPTKEKPKSKNQSDNQGSWEEPSYRTPVRLWDVISRKAKDFIEGKVEVPLVCDRSDFLSPLFNELLGWKNYSACERKYIITGNAKEYFDMAWSHVPNSDEVDRRDHIWEQNEKTCNKFPAVAGQENDLDKCDEHIDKILQRQGVSKVVTVNNDEHVQNVQEIRELMKRRNIRLDPHDYFPVQLAKAIVDRANSMPTAPSYIFTPLLACIASCAGTKHTLIIKQFSDHKETCIIRSAVVAPTGAMKSPAVWAAVRPLHELESEAFEDYKLKLEAYKEEYAIWKSIKDNESPEPKKPTRTRYVVQDTTPEAKAKIHGENPRGFLQYVDELKGHFDSFNKYRNGRGDDEQKDLMEFNGQPLVVDRASMDKEALYVEKQGISITGSTQQLALNQIISNLSKGNVNAGDYAGWLARWLLTAEPAPIPLIDLMNDPGQSPLNSMLNKLYLTIVRMPATVYTLSAEAKLEFQTAHRALTLLEGGEKTTINNALPKLRTYLGRLTLLLHLVHECFTPGTEFISSNVSTVVSADTVRRATKLVNYYLNQLYILIAFNEEGSELSGLALTIQQFAEKRTDRDDGWITHRLIRQFNRSLKCLALEEFTAVVRSLTDAGYGEIDDSGKTIKYRSSPTSVDNCRQSVDATVDGFDDSEVLKNKEFPHNVEASVVSVDNFSENLISSEAQPSSCGDEVEIPSSVLTIPNTKNISPIELSTLTTLEAETQSQHGVDVSTVASTVASTVGDLSTLAEDGNQEKNSLSNCQKEEYTTHTDASVGEEKSEPSKPVLPDRLIHKWVVVPDYSEPVQVMMCEDGKYVLAKHHKTGDNTKRYYLRKQYEAKDLQLIDESFTADATAREKWQFQYARINKLYDEAWLLRKDAYESGNYIDIENTPFLPQIVAESWEQYQVNQKRFGELW